MTTTSSVNNASSTAALNNLTTGSGTVSDATAAQDRFLKLLVAQLNNQDPMNPMDNAQMTSQMAQINTVTGINKLNETMSNMVSQLLSTQILQSASMVGHNVLLAGNTLNVSNGVAAGAVDVGASADSVTVEIQSPGGQVLDTFNLGAKNAGRHEFTWDASAYQGQTVKIAVKASMGGKSVSATPMAVDTIQSVSNESGTLKLNLANGTSVSYTDVAAIY
ncbi:flagellar hook assembly protein FlgD [Curvibacter delicatus]|jgi:flagellar basal-body rod modification protein FlgD|uniref:flagellar hook assembly protein FlgD n=1 Tax=Curvibacter delicatus TaxID=80879 RepID=UPI00082A3FBD|nr:flagellar hook assembly protein FlgD [Curvibacter delicatus]